MIGPLGLCSPAPVLQCGHKSPWLETIGCLWIYGCTSIICEELSILLALLMNVFIKLHCYDGSVEGRMVGLGKRSKEEELTIPKTLEKLFMHSDTFLRYHN